MGRNIKYTSLDRVISKLYRELGIEEISETDVIEWVAEALEAISTNRYLEEVVSALIIKNHQADLPIGLTAIQQVVKDNNFKEEDLKSVCSDEEKDNSNNKFIDTIEVYECPECLQKLDSEILTLPTHSDIEKKLKNTNLKVLDKSRFEPVRLTNHTFFNSLVCEEDSEIYKTCKHEYNIFNNKIRTSFKDGLILISYFRVLLDEETGYPLIPDDYSVINALTYYVMWKYNQKMWFMGREGYGDKMKYSHEMWDKYASQVKSKQTILQGIDEYQNFTEEKTKWINSFKYYNYFGNYGR